MVGEGGRGRDIIEGERMGYGGGDGEREGVRSTAVLPLPELTWTL